MKKMKKADPVKPFNVLDTRSLRQERLAVVDAIQECVALAQPPKPLGIEDFGHYRAPNWRQEDGELTPHMSVDWYVGNAWNMAKEKINATLLMKTLAREPWRQDGEPGEHYDVWLVDHDLYDASNLEQDESVVGLSLPSVGLVLSVRPFDAVGLPTYSLLKTAALHQLGHLFGVPNLRRVEVSLESGGHCPNLCVMRDAGCTAEEWLELNNMRLSRGPYCERCLEDLRGFFYAGGKTQ